MAAGARADPKGFTLIELVAVMAILAVLVAIVAPNVIGSREASIRAQAMQDATQVRAAAADFFSKQDEAGVHTPHTVILTTKLADMTPGTTSATQVVSSSWPEKYITLGQNAPSSIQVIGARYADVFETATDPIVEEVVLMNEEGESISGSTFLSRFTTIDLEGLVDKRLLGKPPAGAALGSSSIPNFLWLFEKTSSSAAPQNAGDSREVAVFKLAKVEKLEGQTTASGTQKVKLTYRQIFGNTSPMPTPTPTPTPTSTPIPTPATLEVRVTDAPPEGVSSFLVTIRNIEINKSSLDTEAGWLSVVPGSNTVDLVAVTGIEETLGTIQVAAGRYNQVRFDLVDAQITHQGVDRPVAVPSGKLRFKGGFDLAAGATTVLTLDFDAARSLAAPEAPQLVPTGYLLTRPAAQPLAAATKVAFLSAPPTLLAQWLLDEGAGTTALDSSVMGRHGTITGGSWVTAITPPVLSFNGSTTQVEVTNSEGLDGRPAFTLQAWVFPTAYPAEVGGIVSKWNDQVQWPAGYSWLMVLRDLGDVKCAIGTSQTVVSLGSPQSLPVGQWSHVACVFQENKNIRVYVNGAPVAEASLQGLGTFLSTPEPVRLGSFVSSDGIKRHFQGRLSDVRIYSGVKMPQPGTPPTSGTTPYVANTFALNLSPGDNVYGLAVNEANNKLYVGVGSHSLSGDDRVLILNAQTGALLNTLSVSADFSRTYGNRELFAVNSSTNDVFLASSDTIFRIDGTSDSVAVVDYVPYGSMVVVNSQANKLYHNDYPGGLVEHDIATGQKTTYPTGYLTSLAFNDVTGKVYAVYGGGVAVLDTTTGTLTSISPVDLGCGGGPPPRIAVNKTTNRVYLTSEQCPPMLVIDGAADTMLVSIPLERPAALAVNEAANKVYVISWAGDITSTPPFYVIDGLSNTARSLDLGVWPTWPETIRFNSAHDKLYVGSQGGGRMFVLPGAGGLVTPPGLVVVDGSDDSVIYLPLGGPVFYLAVGGVSNRVYAVVGGQYTGSGSRSRIDVIDLSQEPRPIFQAQTMADRTVYKNGDTITLTARLDSAGYTLAADFGGVNSSYTTGSETVVDKGGGTYTITHTISPAITWPPVPYTGLHTVVVTARNARGLGAANPIMATASVRLDPDAQVFQGPILQSTLPVTRLTDTPGTWWVEVKLSNGRAAWTADNGLFLYDGTKVVQLSTGSINGFDIHDRWVVWSEWQPYGDSPIKLYDGVETKTIGSGWSAPRVHAGRVAWASGAGVRLYDGGVTRTIGSSLSVSDIDIHDGQVVWKEWRGHVFFYDGATTIQLTDTPVNGERVRVHGGKVVWDAGQASPSWWWRDTSSEIYLYDDSTGQTVRLTSNDFWDGEPYVSQGRVVWVGDVLNRGETWGPMPFSSGTEVFLYDGAAVIQLTNNPYSDAEWPGPQIDQGQVVWAGFDGHDTEIYLFDGTRILQITNNDIEDTGPVISQGRIAWSAWDGQQSDIYMVELPPGTPTPTPPPTPTANSQSVTVVEDTPQAITLTGSDVDGDPLSFVVVAQPVNGILAGTAPDLTYSPNANFHGPDSFTFRVSDGTLRSSLATVSIIVNPVNDAPTAIGVTATTVENDPVSITLLGSDVEGDPLSFVVVTQPANGTLSGTEPNLTYTANANFTGSDSFTFQVSDGILHSNVATVSITVKVNTAPVANSQSVTTAKDVAKGITLTGTDADGHPITFGYTQPLNGTLLGTAPHLIYVPSEGFSGSDSFTFMVNDGRADSNPATISITVTLTPSGPMVTKLDDTNDGVCDADCSLREALTAAAKDDIVTFAPGLSGTVTLTLGHYWPSSPTLSLGKDLTILGPTEGQLSISGASGWNAILNNGASLTIVNIAFEGNPAGGGATAIHNSGGSLAILNSTFTGNSGWAAGAIYNNGGNLTILNSTFTGNSGWAVGAIYNNGGNLTIMDSTFSGNSGYQPDIYNNNGSVTVANTTFS